MPDFSTLCLVLGVLLQLFSVGRRAFVVSSADDGGTTSLTPGVWVAALAGVVLVMLYAWHDADFTLLVGQLFLAAVYRPFPSLSIFRRLQREPQ